MDIQCIDCGTTVTGKARQKEAEAAAYFYYKKVGEHKWRCPLCEEYLHNEHLAAIGFTVGINTAGVVGKKQDKGKRNARRK